MRREKVASRILLILSVVHFAAAAPAIILQRSLKVTEKVTPALDKHGNLFDDSSHHFPRMDNNLPSTSGTLPSQGETSPASGDPGLHSGSPPELGTSQLHIDRPATSDTAQLQDDLPLMPETSPSEDDMSESSTSGTLQLHNEPPPPTRGAVLYEDDTSLSGNRQLRDDPWRTWIQAVLRGESSNEGSPGETSYEGYPGAMQYEGSPEETLYEGSPMETLYDWPSGGIPNDASPGGMLNDASPGETLYLGSPGTSPTSSGAPQLQNDLPPASGTPQLHHDGSEEFDSSYWRIDDLRVIEGLPSSPDFDSETPPPFYSEISPPLHSGTPLFSHLEMPPPLHLDSEVPLPLHSEAPPPLHSETLQLLESEALPSAPETHTFFNDAMRQKLKNYAIVGAVAGVSVGFALGVKKLINNHSHGSHPAGRDLASSGVVGRGPRYKHAPATTQKPGLICSR